MIFDIAGDEYCRWRICQIWELMSYDTRYEWSDQHDVSVILCHTVMVPHATKESTKPLRRNSGPVPLKFDLCFKTCRLSSFLNIGGRKEGVKGWFVFILTIDTF